MTKTVGKEDLTLLYILRFVILGLSDVYAEVSRFPFFSQVSVLRTQNVIGLLGEGDNLGRKGSLELLIFGARSKIYLFDVGTMGKTCWKQLRLVLEDGNILKVRNFFSSKVDGLIGKLQR